MRLLLHRGRTYQVRYLLDQDGEIGAYPVEMLDVGSCSLAKPSPSNDEERKQYVDAVTCSMLAPPSWWKLSENNSAAILIALFAITTFFVVRSSGLWMRLLYGVVWGILLVRLGFRMKYAGKRQP